MVSVCLKFKGNNQHRDIKYRAAEWLKILTAKLKVVIKGPRWRHPCANTFVPLNEALKLHVFPRGLSL